MIEVGNIVKNKYAISGYRARMGIVITMREGAYEDQPLAQIYWPHSGTFGWVEAIDMEVISEGG
jgi:hypothetical protein